MNKNKIIRLFFKLQDDLKDKEHLKSRIQDILKELSKGKEQGRESINTTDPDCVKVKGRQGIHAGYNGQIVVDEKHGLIVHSDVVNESNDVNQFAHQIEQATQTLGHNCTNACVVRQAHHPELVEGQMQVILTSKS